VRLRFRRAGTDGAPRDQIGDVLRRDGIEQLCGRRQAEIEHIAQDASGKAQEKIYDVSWSGSRRPGKDGKLPAVGDTVDVATATWTNTIGAPELSAVWKDPDFDPKQRAVYYARVIEIPTPTWLAYDRYRFGVKMSKDVPMKQQERAWTSPIWYSPR
jgi:hypothetical protein